MRARALTDGLLAGALSLAVLWAASRATADVPFAPVALVERAIRAAPGGLATFSIEQLGHSAVRLLSAGMIAALLLLAAMLPRLTALRGAPRPRLAGGLLAAAFAGALASGPQPVAWLPALIGCAVAGLVYGLALAWLTGTATDVGVGGVGAAGVTRRQALARVGAGASAFALGGTLLGRLVARRGPDTDVALRAPQHFTEVPARPSFPVVAGISPEVTSVADHYVVDIDIDDPVVEASQWELRVSGEVSRPLMLSFDELQSRFPVVEQYSVLTCVSNEVGGDLVGSSRWAGVRLADVLRAAGAGARAVDVVFSCADGYTVGVPVERVMQPYALLAVAQNGQPLTQEHGFPCRIRIPSLYGMMNAKWLESIELVDRDVKGFWAQRGWSDVGIVRTQSRIDTRGDVSAREPTWLAGVAWAGVRGIRGVELSVDGGRAWASARLRKPLSEYAWTQWAYAWTPPQPGLYRVLCRATDGEGRLQDVRHRAPHPSGASGYHELQLRAT